MAKTTKKPTKRDRHLTPVIVTASGQLIAGKRRIQAFTVKHPDTKIAIRELHHYAMLKYLHPAKDDDGNMFLATQSTCDENGWTILGEEVQP